MIFENWSAHEPETWVPPSQGGTLPMDATVTKEDCTMDWEIAEFLGFSGYQVSEQKAQLIKEKEAICRMPRTPVQSYLQAGSV